MDKTYVFNSEPASSGKVDIMGILPNILGGNNSLDPNLLLALNNGNRNQDMWGGAGIWWIWILLLFGWGRNGWGGFGNNNGDGCGVNAFNGLPAWLNGDSGREMLMNAIQGNGNAIQSLANTLHCDISSLQTQLCNISSAIQGVGNQVGMSSQQIINSIQSANCSLSAQLSQCCCDVRTAIERQGYEGRLSTLAQTDSIKEDANSKFNIISSKIDAQTQLLSDQFCALEKRELNREINQLRDERTALQTSALLQQQSQNLIGQLRPCPIPSYNVCNPYGTTYGSPLGYNGYGYGYANYGNCGCNNGCNSCGC